LPEDGCRDRYITIDMGTEGLVRVCVYRCKYLRLREGRLYRGHHRQVEPHIDDVLAIADLMLLLAGNILLNRFRRNVATLHFNCKELGVNGYIQFEH
jgi:hypothetical protein